MKQQPIFITGIGTGIGKTVLSAIVAKALNGLYWKPIQSGVEEGTDAGWVQRMAQLPDEQIIPEVYQLQLPASPHIAAKAEGIQIEIGKIVDRAEVIPNVNEHPLIIEGAGGILVPLNENEFIVDLISALQARVLLVSRNYLGSINHSLLTANYLEQKNIPVVGWIFNDHFMDYEAEIANWSHLPVIGSVPFSDNISTSFITEQASILAPKFKCLL